MNHEITAAVEERLAEGRPFVVATIIHQEGSTPRLPGTKMVIAADGTSRGTVGGGLLEAAVLERAREVLHDGRPQRMRFKLTTAARDSMDMICGGVAEVLIDRIDPEGPSGRCLADWCRVCRKEDRGALLTVLEGPSRGAVATTHFIVGRDDGEDAPSRTAPAALRQKASGVTEGLALLDVDGLLGVVEPVRPAHPLYIFGAGHVSQPTAQLAAMVGFRVRVFDDRAEFARADRFPEADTVTVIEDLGRALAGLAVNAESFVVIVTRGHLHDQTVLAQALKTEAGYIGMIGSRSKRAAIYHNLRREGVTDADLERVSSPIGLAIGARTPAEIAVSIVAELIQRRSGMRA